MVDEDQLILDDAQLVSRYASEIGIQVDSLRDAITAAQNERAGNPPSPVNKLTSQTKQKLLAAQGEAIGRLPASNIKTIKGWYSKTNAYWGVFNRSAAFIIVVFCLINLIPFTFLYSDINTRIKNIASFCNLAPSATDSNKTEQSVNKCLEWTFEKAKEFRDAHERAAVKAASSNANNGQSLSLTSDFTSEGSITAAAFKERTPPVNQPILQQGKASTLETDPDYITIKLYSSPPTIMLLLDYFLSPKADDSKDQKEQGWNRRILSIPTSEAELNPLISQTPGVALYMVAQDYGFMVYVLGSGYLPMLYGMLGASVFLLRRSLSNDPADYLIVTSGIQAMMRIGLGGVAGIIIGWFNLPDAQSITNLASTQFAIAFLAGFSIDIVFALLDRMVSVFDFKR